MVQGLRLFWFLLGFRQGECLMEASRFGDGFRAYKFVLAFVFGSFCFRFELDRFYQVNGLGAF